MRQTFKLFLKKGTATNLNICEGAFFFLEITRFFFVFFIKIEIVYFNMKVLSYMSNERIPITFFFH